MNYAFTNGKILNGTKDMQIQEGLCILVQEGKMTDMIVTAKNPLEDLRALRNPEMVITFNKAIQKMQEYFRITPEEKAALKAMKR